MMEDQERALTFQCCMSAVNIFRFLTDHVKVMSLSVVSRILDVHGRCFFFPQSFLYAPISRMATASCAQQSNQVEQNFPVPPDEW